MKQYVVYFFIKADRTEYLADVVIEASSLQALQGVVLQQDRQECVPSYDKHHGRCPEVVRKTRQGPASYGVNAEREVDCE